MTRQSIRTPRLEILSNAERLMGALGITIAVRVVESALVQVPTVMGWIKPVVLLPAAAMSGMSMEQINALVAHELAHIKRHDYLVNLVQSAIETLLFYHPMVWIISRRVREERELCCDDLAISVCNNDRLTYASALADLESLRQLPTPALAANGGSLLQRVKRILTPDDVQTVRGRGHWIAGAAILAITVALLGVQAKAKGSSAAEAQQAVRDAVVGAVRGGVASSVQGALVPGALTDSVTDGVTGGVEDQQVVLPGHMVRLEVMVRASVQQAEVRLTAVVTQLQRIKVARLEAEADFRRLVGVSLAPDDAVIAAVKTVPGLADDPIATHIASDIEAKKQEVERQKTVQLYGDNHPSIVSLRSKISTLTNELHSRELALVDAARINYESRKELEDKLNAELVSEKATAVSQTSARSSDLSKDYTVQEDGTIVVPFAGRLKVVGQTIAVLERTVRAALQAKGIRVVSLDATLEGRASDASLFVLGEVKNPGAYPWRNGITFSHAVSMAGGVTDAAALDRAEIRVNNSVLSRSVAEVPAGATIVLPTLQMRSVMVTGAVKKTGRVSLSENSMTLENAINAAGGLAAHAGPTIRVRQNTDTDWQTHKRTATGGLPAENITLADNATVDVPASPKVTVRGAVKTPGEYEWQEGLTLQRLLLKAGGVASIAALNRISVSTPRGAEMNAKTTYVIPENAEVDVPEQTTIAVFVRGAVRTPGRIRLTEEHAKLVDALNASGGFLPSAGSEIKVKRADSETWQSYSRDDLNRGRLEDVAVYADAIIEVPVAPKFFVNGLVITPGEYQWEPGLTLGRAILKAGGVSPQGAINRTQLRRLDPATQKYRDVNFAKEFKGIDRFSVKIEANDIITIPKRRM